MATDESIGHWNLVKAGILHRDISINNVFISSDGEKGVLIDLDAAASLAQLHVILAMEFGNRVSTRVFF